MRGFPFLLPDVRCGHGLLLLLPRCVFRLPAAVRRALCVCAGFLSRFFAFSCLTSSSQKSFHLSLRPRRASTFFRKESRQRFAKGLRPFEPHSCALRPIFSSSALLAGLTALRAAIRRLIRETLEKTKEQSSAFSSVSVRWGCAGAFARRVSSRPQGTGGRISPRPGKQEPCVGLHPEPAACVRD